MAAQTSCSRLSQRLGGLHGSAVREILAVAGRPGVISFAGGLPAQETFPQPDLRGMPADWMQYGPSEGDPQLRELIARHLRDIGLDCPAERILVISGSQQGIDLAAKLFIDPGTPVCIESPTYIAALQVFRFFGARFVDLPTEANLPDVAQPPALAYVNPTFQNPTGHCLSAAERDLLARRCDTAGIAVFEDDPYRDLAYEACDRTPVCARLRRSSWIYQGSFSKTFAPGLRLGFLAASADLIGHLVRLKQAADLHSSRIGQWLVLQHMQDAGRADRLRRVVSMYRDKRDAFAAMLDERFHDLATWNIPAGGLFFWLRVKGTVDGMALLASAIEQGVAFMPGEPFFAHPERAASSLRLNFSHAGIEQAGRGLDVLADLLGRARVRPPAPDRAPVLQAAE